MINFFSTWVKDLSLALIIVSILEMILPNSKIKKYVKMVMGLYILFTIISPFIDAKELNLNSINDYIENSIETSSTNLEIDQTSMDDKLSKLYEEELEKNISEKIEENGYEVDECRVNAHISEDDNGIEKIVVKIKGKLDVQNNEIENDTDSIENKIVTEIQKIQKVDVKVSENDKEDDQEENKKTNITKSDIRIIKDLLIKEYGVKEKCLKIS